MKKQENVNYTQQRKKKSTEIDTQVAKLLEQLGKNFNIRINILDNLKEKIKNRCEKMGDFHR